MKYPAKAADRSRSKAYKRVGIRRDQDLGDLSSSSQGLENLIDSFVDDQINENFVVSDLNSIKNIFARGLTPENYQSIIGSSVKFTTPDGEIASYDPRITYQNRLDKFQSFSGIPRLAGGSGLTANYFQNDQINFTSLSSFQYNKPGGNPLDPNLSESNIFLGTTSEGLIQNDNFWEHGEFAYSAKVHPQSVKANGGIMWEGYYIPRMTGLTGFSVSSTGFYTVDFAKEGYFETDEKVQTPASQSTIGVGQTYTNYARVGLTTVVTATGGIGNTMAVPVNRVPTIGVGMTVSGSNISGVPVVFSTNKDNGVITLEPSSGITSSISGTLSGSNNITFSRSLGDEVSHTFNSHVLLAFEKYRIRIRYFHPQVAIGDTTLENQIRSLDKRIIIHHRPPNGTTHDDLHFRYLYSMDYDFSESAKGDFNKYFDKSVLFGGTNLGVGIGNRSNFNEYIRLKSTNKVDLKYKVKENLTKITKVSSRPGSFVAGGRIINMNPTSNIEIGNYVFGTNIQPGTRVEQITINSFIVVDKPLGGSGSQNPNITFIDHRGFVKKVTGSVADSGSNAQITGITTALTASPQSASTIDTDVQVGMVAISSKLNSYAQITTVDEGANTLIVNKNIASGQSSGSGDFYIYQSRGLKDNSIQTFCDKFNSSPEIRCLVSSVSGSPLPIGTKTFSVDDINGVQSGWELQGSYFGTAGITIPTNGISGNTITLDTGIEKPLPDDAQFTAVSPNKNQNADFQLCCPPTDTSPPFNASEEGLDTIGGTAPNLEIHKGNLIFDSLIIQDTNSNVSEAVPSDTVNRKIDIKTPLGNYSLLATT